MANKILLGKSTNSNLGHSSAKYGLWICRDGEEDVTTCAKDELIFNTDTFGNASGAIGIGQLQVMPHSGTSASQQVSVSGGGTTAITWTDLDIDLIFAQSFAAGTGGGSGTAPANDQYQNAQSYGGQTGVTISNTGSASLTSQVVAWRGFSSLSLY